MTPPPPRLDDDAERHNGNQDRRISQLERQIIALEEQMKYSITGGASRELHRVSKELEALEGKVGRLEIKTTRWEGGGYVLMAIGSILGMVMGWLASKLGLIK